MKKFFKKASSLTIPASYFASKFGKKKRSVKDDSEEVSELPDLPDLEDMINGTAEEEIIVQASAPEDESFVDSFKKVDIFENGHQSQTLLLNKTDEIFSSPSLDPYINNTNVNVLEQPVSFNVPSVSTLKYHEKPAKGYTMVNDSVLTTRKEKGNIMQKKIDDLEKVSENQSKEISELKSILNDCLSRLVVLEGGSKTAKDKSSTPNSLRLTSPKATKEVQLRKSLTSPRTPVKAARLSGTPTRRSTSDLANHKEATFVKGEGVIRIFIKGRPVNLYVPTTLTEGFDIKSQTHEPDENLKMEWVYGYRGKDCRKNLYYLPTGDLVYFVAGIVVLHNLQTQTQRHYLEHTDDIKCMALHPDKVTLATGQVAGHSKVEGKPHVRIWNSSSLQTIHIIGLGFFERAVSALGFSKSDGGKLLCTIDDANDHNITVWNWTVNKSICTSKSSTEAVIEAEFNPTDSNVIVTCGKNHLSFWIIEKSNLIKKMAIFEKYEKPKFVSCVTFTKTGELISGDSSGNIFFWSKEKRSIVSAINQAHNGPIFCLMVTESGSLLSGGGKDHSIFEWNLSSKEKTERIIQLTSDYGHCRTICEMDDKLIVGTTNNAIVEVTGNENFVNFLNGHSDEVCAIASFNSKEHFISGGHDRRIILWDALSRSILHTKQVEKNIQSMCVNSAEELITVGCVEGYWYIYDAAELNEVYGGRDGNEPIQCCEFSPDGSHLAIGSRDNFIYIYKVNASASEVIKVGKCSGHSSFITHIDWATDGQHLRSNSGDYELLFWNIGDCKQITAASSLADTPWHTCNCTLAFEVAGIWPEGSDGTDINAVTKAHNKLIIASADDFGKVNLYRYPACATKAAHKIYKGHSSHVTAVAFLAEDHRLTSAGGQDTAIVQWALV